MSDEVAIIVGTRPELIKMSPVIRACERDSIEYSLIHTGQHYSENLDGVFFEQLDLPEPTVHLGVGSGTHGAQTGEMLTSLEQVLLRREPSSVLVQGDTNSVLAGALAASKLDTELGHVEAGLRSHDRTMPEEINRIVGDHVADQLFAPTEQSRENLLNEGIPASKIHVTGNTVVDALYHHRHIAAEESDALDRYGLSPGRYTLLTAHRAENVDDPRRFQSLLDGVGQAARSVGLPVIYPVHPRAKERIEQHRLAVPDPIRCVAPLSYLDFLHLEDNADLILTDSGGVQEEACILGVPCVTLRDTTERPETVSIGSNRLCGVEPPAIVEAVETMRAVDRTWENPFGDGNAAARILRSLGVVVRNRGWAR